MEGKEVELWRRDAANAFIRSRMKRDGGLNLSDRVWNYTQQTKGEFELAVSQVLEQGIGKGISAEALGRQVRRFLNNGEMMYRRYHMKKLMSDGTKKDVVEWRRRVVDDQGKVHFVKEDLAKVGTGVYRSSRQNALRLTITETNMAYNFANCERWSSEPYVLGIRIRLSGNHPEEDICDELAGDYPKDFMWRGWHPRCRCSMSSILMDRDGEEWKHLHSLPEKEYKAYQSPNAVKNVPEKFNKWCERNAKKLDLAREKGKLPYFVRDNQKVVGRLLGWEEEHAPKQMSSRERILAAAKARHEARTDNQINDILARWDARKYTEAQRNNFKGIEESLGIKRGVSMDFEKANQGNGNVDYKSGLIEFRVNCQSSVVAHELRMRGFDVTAQPNWKMGDAPNRLSHGTWKCWIKADGTPFERPELFAYKFSKRGSYVGLPYKETIQQINEHTKEVGRYHVSFDWKGEKYGHIVTMERKADGTALWYDPQTGERNFFNKEYAKKIKGVRAYRVDNLLFDAENWNVVRPISDQSKRTSKISLVKKANEEGTLTLPIKKEGTISGTRVNLSKEIIAYRDKVMSEILNMSTTPELHDGKILYSKKSLKRSIVHAKNEAEVDMFKYAITHTEELLYKRKSILGEVKNMNKIEDARNVEKKKKRGVIHYNEYELHKDNKVWLIKTEVYKKISRYHTIFI